MELYLYSNRAFDKRVYSWGNWSLMHLPFWEPSPFPEPFSHGIYHQTEDSGGDPQGQLGAPGGTHPLLNSALLLSLSGSELLLLCGHLGNCESSYEMTIEEIERYTGKYVLRHITIECNWDTGSDLLGLSTSHNSRGHNVYITLVASPKRLWHTLKYCKIIVSSFFLFLSFWQNHYELTLMQ